MPRNLRTEQFDIDVCDEVAAFYTDWFDALWEESGRSQDNQAIIKAVYDRYNPPSPEEAGKPAARSAKPAEPERKRAGPARLEDVTMSAAEMDWLLGD